MPPPGFVVDYVDERALSASVLDVVAKYDVHYGYMHLGSPHEANIGVPLRALRFEQGGLRMGVPVQYLRRGIPQLWWLNILGAPYTALLPDFADLLATAPAGTVGQSGGKLVVQVTESADAVTTNWASYVQRRDVLKTLLGGRLFLDHVSPIAPEWPGR